MIMTSPVVSESRIPNRPPDGMGATLSASLGRSRRAIEPAGRSRRAQPDRSGSTYISTIAARVVNQAASFVAARL